MPRRWARLLTVSGLKDAFTGSQMGSQRPSAGDRGSSEGGHSFIAVLKLSGLVFSRLGWAAWTTWGLCLFPGSCSEAVREQSIYTLANLGPWSALTAVNCAVLLCWLWHLLYWCHLSPPRSRTTLTQWQHCILKNPSQEVNLVASSDTWCKHWVSEKQLGTITSFNEIPAAAKHGEGSQRTLRSLSPKINEGSRKA